MATASKAIAIFLRYPQAGKVKTRLAAGVGAEAAQRIYCKLLRRTLGIAADFKGANTDLEIILFCTPADKQQALAEMLPGPWWFAAQQGAHLGERMHRAIEQTLARGHRHVVLIGSDAADLQTTDFADAFQALAAGAAFLGPAADGGFYLVGLDRPCPAAFASSQWGGPEVFQRTRDLLTSAGFEVCAGALRKDIDRPEDIALIDAQPALRAKLSVIIPTRNSPAQLSPLLQTLETGLWPDDEIIVSSSARPSLPKDEPPPSRARESCTGLSLPSCRHKAEAGIFRGLRAPAGTGLTADGNSATKFATDHRVRIVHSPVGRGVQMNRGAQAASGDLYWFLHDDSVPPGQFAYHVRKLLTLPGKSLGCFLLDFSPSNRALELIARWANFRTVHCGRPYGDQGLFCRAEVFHQLGGFHKAFLMEDIDFVHRAKRFGGLLVIPEKLITSSARYLHGGVLRTSLRNHWTVLLHLAGVKDRKLYSLYYGTDDPAAAPACIDPENPCP